MALDLEDLAYTVRDLLGRDVLDMALVGEMVSVRVPRSRLCDVLLRLRDARGMTQLMDICGVDYPARASRFDVVYHLLNLRENARLRVKVAAAEGDVVPSVRGIYSAAGWFEREVWDMFGIPFGGHPDLRRILTDYGFEGHPLRKDFPLTGFVEVHYDDVEKRVVYAPVRLQQEYRAFDAQSPWRGPGQDQRQGLDREGT